MPLSTSYFLLPDGLVQKKFITHGEPLKGFSWHGLHVLVQNYFHLWDYFNLSSLTCFFVLHRIMKLEKCIILKNGDMLYFSLTA